MTRLTVFFDTPARDATSLIVGFEFSKFFELEDISACGNEHTAGQVGEYQVYFDEILAVYADLNRFALTPVS